MAASSSSREMVTGCVGDVAGSMGKSSDLSFLSDALMRTYYLYAFVGIQLGDISVLGDMEFVLSESATVEPSPGTAAILLCVAHANQTWMCRLLEGIDQWLGYNGNCCKCYISFSPAARKLFRRSSSVPLGRWRVKATAGEVWERYSFKVLERMRGAVSEMSLFGITNMGPEDPLTPCPREADTLETYHLMLMESGYDVCAPYPTKCELARACHAKYLQALECIEVKQMLKIVQEVSGEGVELDLRREIVGGTADDESCTIS